MPRITKTTSTQGCSAAVPRTNSPANTAAPTISGLRLDVLAIAPAPEPTATDDDEPPPRMATRIQIGSHSPQDSNVSTACKAWLVPSPVDTATATAGAGGGGTVGDVGTKC